MKIKNFRSRERHEKIILVPGLTDFEVRLLVFLLDEYELNCNVELRDEYHVLRDKLDIFKNGK